MEIFLVLVLFGIHYCTLFAQNPQNIIFIIADGMGPAQAYISYTVSGGQSNLQRCPIIGLNMTYSASDYVTDSSAGGTALATGYKTYNGAIGVDTDTNDVKSILEIASEKKKATGVVVTSTITHATPASFLAHHFNRRDEESIALDFLKSPVNLLIGGGEKYFNNRSDKRNLIDSLKERNFEIITAKEYNNNPQVFNNLSTDTQKNICVFTHTNKPDVAKKRGDVLARSSDYAIRKLSTYQENGFFLMIESSQIDWACHRNNAGYLKDELLDFEAMLDVVLDFAEKDGNTLVVITADHECGGLTIDDGDFETGEIDVEFSSGVHTGIWVPIFSYGPGSDFFSDINQNTEIFDKLNQIIK